MAERNLGHQPELAALQREIRELRDGGLLEVADSEKTDLSARKTEREGRFEPRVLKETLRKAVEDSERRCSDMARQPWVGGWEAPAFADEYLEERMRLKRREKMMEKLRARMVDPA